MVAVVGGRVYVRVNGDLAGPRPPLVAIHGGPGTTHNYLVELLALADERAIILYDQLDSGRSDRPNDPRNWTVRRFADEVEAIRTALGVDRWHVCGHSWGGTVALDYGARRPAALRGLVLASPLVSVRSWRADVRVLRSQLPGDARARLAVCARPGVSARVCEAAAAPFDAAYVSSEGQTDARRAYDRVVGGRGDNAAVSNAMWGPGALVPTGTLRGYDGEPLLSRLDGPRTMLMVGQYDEARPSTALGFARRISGCEIAVIPGAGHLTMTDRPEETVAVLRAFLARQDARV